MLPTKHGYPNREARRRIKLKAGRLDRQMYRYVQFDNCSKP